MGLQIFILTLAFTLIRVKEHLPKAQYCPVTDKQPVACPHCSSQFINQSVLDSHLQRCPVTEDERNVGRGRGQGRGRSTGQVGQSFLSETNIFKYFCGIDSKAESSVREYDLMQVFREIKR